MNTRSPALMAIAGLSIGVGIFYLQRRIRDRGEEAPVVVASASPSPVRARDLYRVALPKGQALGGVDDACRATWRQLVESSLDELVRDVEAQRFELPENCTGRRLELSGLHRAQLKSCHSASRPLSDDQRRECLGGITFLRATLIDELSRDVKDFASLEDSVLMNKILARFSRGGMSGAALDETLSIVEALSLKAPGLYAVAKARVAALMLKSFEDPTLGGSERFLSAVQEAQALDPRDPQLFEASLAPSLIASDYDRVDELVRDYAVRNPASGLPLFYGASKAWREERRDESVALLIQALEREPGHVRYVAALERVRTAPLGTKNIFRLEIRFDFADF